MTIYESVLYGSVTGFDRFTSGLSHRVQTIETFLTQTEVNIGKRWWPEYWRVDADVIANDVDVDPL